MELMHGGDWVGFESEYGSRPLDFSASISPLGMPAAVRAAACEALRDADRYPDPLCRTLRAALAEHHGVPMENIVCGNGAADLIWRLCRAAKPGKAAVFVPSFTEYERALRAVDCETALIALPEAADFRLTAETAALVPPGTDLLFLCNPNNPTGLLAEPAALQLCRERCSQLVVDECFLDFCAAPDAHSLIRALRETPGLVILKAFTKTYAMAGLRLGYALCGSAETAEKLQSCDQPWAVSQIAQAAGLAALNEEDYVNQMRGLITQERRRMIPALKDLGLRAIPGEANYLLFRAQDTALSGKLRERGILLRGCGDFAGLDAHWYRAAVRTREENDQLLRTLGVVLHG